MTDQLTDNEVPFASVVPTISEFMGVKLVQMQNYDYWLMPDGEKIDYWSLDYRSDWRLLMPVWYKFKELKIEDREYVGHYFDIERAILHLGCSEACKLLADGIRWYNSIKTSK